MRTVPAGSTRLGARVVRLVTKQVAAAVFAASVLVATVLGLWPFAFLGSVEEVRAKWTHVEWAVFYFSPDGSLIIDADLLLNLFFLAPLGVAWSFMIELRHPLRAGLEALLLGLLVSFVIEGVQVLTPDRTTQLADLWRNALGAGVAGVVAAWLRPRLGSPGERGGLGGAPRTPGAGARAADRVGFRGAGVAPRRRPS